MSRQEVTPVTYTSPSEAPSLPRVLFVALAVIALTGGADRAGAQQNRNFDDVQIEILPVQGNVYMLVGPGGNVTVQVGADGVLVVDTMFAELSDKLLAAIRELSDAPIRHVINTHVHPDHIGGNHAISAAGDRVIGGNFSRDLNLEDAAPVIAHQNVLTEVSTREPAPPFDLWPTSTYLSDSKDMYVNGESIRILHMPNAHTNGDSIVWFRRSDVISTGDIFNTYMYPYIDVEKGGSLEGLIAALNEIIDLTVPANAQEGGTMIVPGHGRITDEFEIVEYRDMLTIIRDRMLDLIGKGMSLREVKEMRPTRGYDSRWGADTPFWTTEQFVETMYRELSRKQKT